MSDTERKLFPIETVVALINGKQDVDLKEIAGYITGRSIVCDKMAAAVAPFAAAWVSRLYPDMATLIWDEKDGTWPAFIARCSYTLGSKVSMPVMGGPLQASCAAVLDAMTAMHDEAQALKKQVEELTAQVEALKPLEGKLKEANTRADKLDDQLKAAKKDMGALRRQTLEFDGKIAVDEKELQDVIKSAIKANLKTIRIGGGPAAGAAGAAAADAADDFGAAAPSGDEFGFGEGGDSGSKDEFGF